MIEKFIEAAKKLSCVLRELLEEKYEDDKCPVALFEPDEDEHEQVDSHLYQITFIPPRTKHPLRHIATSSENGFFLLGKAILESEYNEDGENEIKVSLVELSRRRVERVLVGTPISQEVIYLNGSEPLHQGSSSSTSSRSSMSKSQSCVYDWNVTNVIGLQAISLQKTRYLISLFDYCLANNLLDGVDNIPIWVSVDEKNPRSVTHMATLTNSSSAERKYMNHVIVSCKGPFKKPEDIPNMTQMKTWHNPRALGSLVENTSHAYALYELLGISQSHEVDEEDQKSLAYVEFTWKNISSVLQPPPLTSDCVLHIQSFPGTMQLSAVSLTMEVNKLCSFLDLIADAEQPWPDLSSEDAEDVHSKMEKVLESLNAGELYQETAPQPDDDNDTSNVFSPLAQLSHQDFTLRKDIDFAESLWLVLKESVDLDDLASSLQVALFALLNGTCQPVIRTANKTSLAVFIRELLKSETNEQKYKLRLKVEKMLRNETALRCLVEIGAEKLMRDHTNYFLSEELVTQDQLSYYVDGNVTLAERVTRVSKLHNVLDLILTTKCVVNTGYTNLQFLTQAALSYYENNDSCNHPLFSLSLPAYGASSTSVVKNIISTHQPSVWCLALTSSSKKGTLTSIVQLSTESPLNKLPDFDVDESQVNEKEDLAICGTLNSKIPYYLSFAQQTMVPLTPRQY